jgi:hypothetical protein
LISNDKEKYKEKGVQGLFDVEFRIEQINETKYS